MADYRYSLRALLIAMLVTGAGLGMLVRWGQSLDERARIMTRVQLIRGARLTWSSPILESDDAETWTRLFETQIQSHCNDSDLVCVSCDSATLAGLRLGAISELRSIVFIGATDDDLRGLVGIDRLEELLLVDYRGTSDGLRSLGAHNRLSRLGVSGRLTAAELEVLGSIPGIEAFYIDFAQVDMGGLPVTRDLIRQHLRQVEQGQIPSLVQPIELP